MNSAALKAWLFIEKILCLLKFRIGDPQLGDQITLIVPLRLGVPLGYV